MGTLEVQILYQALPSASERNELHPYLVCCYLLTKDIGMVKETR